MLYFSVKLQSEITAATYGRKLFSSQQWADILRELRGDSKALIEFIIWNNSRPIKADAAA